MAQQFELLYCFINYGYCLKTQYWLACTNQIRSKHPNPSTRWTNQGCTHGPASPGWTLPCTGLKLWPPFNCGSTWGTKGALDTALNRSRRSTIQRNKKKGGLSLCLEKSVKRETDKTPLSLYEPACLAACARGIIPPSLAEPSYWKLCFQIIIVNLREGPAGSPVRSGRTMWVDHALN